MSLAGLFKVGKLTDSLNVYVPMMVLQRGISLGRVLVFMYLLSGTGQFGLLAVGMMIFEIGGQIVTLGSGHGLVRYVSVYEARGRLRWFFRRTVWVIVAVCTLMTALAAAFHEPLTQWLIRPSGTESLLSPAGQRMLCLLALANVLLMGLYLNLLSFLYGLRTYRLVTVLEMTSCILFTLLGVAVLLVRPSGSAVLAAHAVAVAVALSGGTWLLLRGLKLLGQSDDPPEVNPDRDGDVVLDPSGDEETAVALVAGEPVSAGESPRQAVIQLYRFGIIILASGLLGLLVRYVSFEMTHKAYGEQFSGVFFGVMRFTQPIDFIASAVFTVVFSHVARSWEGDRRQTASSVLEASYKAVVLGLMTVSVVLYVTAELWIQILPGGYEAAGLGVVGGQLLFFQTLANLSLLHIAARLHERPVMIALSAGVAGVLNILLARWWIAAHPDGAAGVAGAAWAMGIALFVGGGAVAVIYLLRSDVRLAPVTYFIFLSPALLMLPPMLTAGVWMGVLLLTVMTDGVLSAPQKEMIESYLHAAGRLRSWGGQR